MEDNIKNRQKFEDRIKAKYPDYDQEAIYKHAMDSYDTKKNDLSDLQKASSSIIDLMENNPDAIDFFQAISETGDVQDALLTLPEDVLEEALERKRSGIGLSDSEKQAKINKHREDILSRRELKKRLKDNEPKSLQAIEEYAKSKNITPQDVLDRMLPIINKIQENDFDEDVLNLFFYKDIMSQEYNRGLADGRNKKIEQTTIRRSTSGLPQPTEANTVKQESQKRNNGNPFAFMGE
ncbi:MAG: hypothetical protein Q4Q06_02940 [Bacteroidota bacterium]|nr:hypothetical protein [Bacteroidota bacterium]